MTTIAAVQSAICKRFDLTHAELVGDCRGRGFAQPRQLAYYACRRLTGQSLPVIARHFGDRDHTTLISGIRRAQQRVASDPVWSGHLACVEVMAK